MLAKQIELTNDRYTYVEDIYTHKHFEAIVKRLRVFRLTQSHKIILHLVEITLAVAVVVVVLYSSK